MKWCIGVAFLLERAYSILLIIPLQVPALYCLLHLSTVDIAYVIDNGLRELCTLEELPKWTWLPKAFWYHYKKSIFAYFVGLHKNTEPRLWYEVDESVLLTRDQARKADAFSRWILVEKFVKELSWSWQETSRSWKPGESWQQKAIEWILDSYSCKFESSFLERTVWGSYKTTFNLLEKELSMIDRFVRWTENEID